MFTHYKNIILCLIISFSLFNSAQADSDKLELAWELEGLKSPESVLYDPEINMLFVSNMNGGPFDKDHKGYISVVSEDGKMLTEKWVEGLNAPKGMGINGRTLYVADIDELVAIDIDHGRIINRYKVDDAKFFNDITVSDNGDIFVSDMTLNRIHKLSGDDFEIWVESEQLENPNGLHFTEDDIIVGSWGIMTDGFATEVPGHLLRISLNTKNISSVGEGKPVGNIDGLEGSDETGFYVTDWFNGGLLHVDSTGATEKLIEFDQGSADFDFLPKKGMFYIPHMIEGKLYAYKLK